MSRKGKALSTLKYGVNFPLHCTVSAHHNTKTQTLLCAVNHRQNHMSIKQQCAMHGRNRCVSAVGLLHTYGPRNLKGGIWSLF